MTSTPLTLLRNVRWPELLTLLWLYGAIFVFGVSIGRSTLWRRLLQRSSQAPSPQLSETAAIVARRLRLRTPFRVRATSLNAGPVIVGLRSPTIYLPSSLCAQLKPRQLEAILAHELLHIRRHDARIGAVQFLAQTLWWFHPLVWWMNGQIVRQRERCCDEEVIANLGGRRRDYAQSLVEILEARHRLEPVGGYPGVRPIELTKNRLEEIMTRPGMSHLHAPVWCWAVALLLALLTLPSGGTVVLAEERPAASATADSRAAEKRKNDRPPALLKYGDGKADGKKSYGGSGMMIRFELPEGARSIHGIRIHGSRYGYPQAPQEDFEITFLDEDLEEILHSEAAPYHLFKRGKEQWVRVTFDKPVELPKIFWIALNFNAAQTKGVYVSFDTSTGGEFSRVGLAGDETLPKETGTGGDWMIQAMLTRTGR